MTIMKGAPVAAAMKEEMLGDIHKLAQKGITPKLAIVRVGDRPDDTAYEKGAVKKLSAIGINCCTTVFSQDISNEQFKLEFAKINQGDCHGILLFRPLPPQIDEEEIRNVIDPRKDIDCMSPLNAARIFAGDDAGFAPCTAAAVMEALRYYNINITGKRVTIIGRSMVVGRPLSMLMLQANATVTICHTRTKDLREACRNAEIVVAAAGRAEMVTADYIENGSIVIDVGINVSGDGSLCGDVDYKSVAETAGAITPVPGGIGTVTTSVLARHVILAAKRSI